MKPVLVELTDFKTKQVVDTLEVDAVLVATGRAPFTQARARACRLRMRHAILHDADASSATRLHVWHKLRLLPNTLIPNIQGLAQTLA